LGHVPAAWWDPGNQHLWGFPWSCYILLARLPLAASIAFVMPIMVFKMFSNTLPIRGRGRGMLCECVRILIQNWRMRI
jgi:hypothetical protein